MSSFFGLLNFQNNGQGDHGGGESSSAEVLLHQQQQMNMMNSNYFNENNESLSSLPSLSQTHEQEQEQEQRDNEEAGPQASASASNNIIPLSKEAEALIANGMRYLTLREREEVTHAVHGVEDLLEENPTMIQQSLEQLNKELDSYIIRKQQQELQQASTTTSHEGDDDDVESALYYALTNSPSYVRTSKFLLMFLRATLFNVEESVKRMVLFFNVKANLFGWESLGRDISLTQDFSSPQDQDALYCGYTQMLPGRDRAGRAIVFYLSDRRIGKSTKSIVSASVCVLGKCRVVCLCPLSSFPSPACFVSLYCLLLHNYKSRHVSLGQILVLFADGCRRRCNDTTKRSVFSQI